MNKKYNAVTSTLFSVLLTVAFGLYCRQLVLAQASSSQTQQASHGSAGQPGASTEDLQKAVQNPVANLISVPFQNNIDFGNGPFDRTKNTLNIQPVVPFQLSESVMLITRTIFPVILQPDLNTPNQEAFGLGDINPTFFFAPAKPGKLIWGIGPTFLLPTATDHLLGTGKWSAGPSVVALVQPGKWTIGALVSNVWSFAGQKNRPAVNSFDDTTDATVTAFQTKGGPNLTRTRQVHRHSDINSFPKNVFPE